jgi:hypothetical protein
VEKVGFQPLPHWPSCFWHPELKLLLVVYVDDLKLSGPADSLAKGWSLIRSGIRTEEPTKLVFYLGCLHEQSERTLPGSGERVRVIEYNVEDFLRSCVDRYRELIGFQYFRHAATPFLTERMAPDFSGRHDHGSGDAEAVSAEAVERALQAAADRQPCAAKVLMKILYAARYASFDLLRAVCSLAQHISKWSSDCDCRSYSLVCYVNSTLHLRMTG